MRVIAAIFIGLAIVLPNPLSAECGACGAELPNSTHYYVQSYSGEWVAVCKDCWEKE